MELGTFGAIMKYALEIENRVFEFYRTACTLVSDPALTTSIEALVERSQKRLKTLERVRRENVTEMILEPIEEFDSDSYQIKTEIPEGSNEESIKKLATVIETTLLDFYNLGAMKIEFLPEASYAFELLAEKNEEAVKLFSS